MATLWEEVLAAARKASDVAARDRSAGAVSLSDWVYVFPWCIVVLMHSSLPASLSLSCVFLFHINIGVYQRCS